jgi:nucleotide-binding universal stress UspA family protein
MPFRNILVPIDFSASSRLAMRQALALARGSGARLHVMYVWEPPRVVSPEVHVLSGGRTDSVAGHARRVADQRMREFLDDFGFAAGERPAYEVLVGDPAQAILERAEGGAYDLIVMGTHGRTGLPRLLVGSVTEKVVRRAPCPVLTLRALDRSGPFRSTTDASQ